MLKLYVELEKIVDNRDKFLKLIQNVYLLKSYLNEEVNLEKQDLNFKIYQQIYIARRLYKFGKSLQTFNTLIEYRKSYNPKRTLLQIPQAVNEMSTYIVYASYIIFNLFENLMVIHQLGFFKSYFDHKILKIITHAFWSVGLLTQLVYYLNRLRANFRKEAELKTQIQNGMTTTEFMDNISILSRERYVYGMVIARFVGDLACALQKTHIPEKILNTRFNKGLVACGGIMSSLIQLYQVGLKKEEKRQNHVIAI